MERHETTAQYRRKLADNIDAWQREASKLSIRLDAVDKDWFPGRTETQDVAKMRDRLARLQGYIKESTNRLNNR